MLCAEEMQSLRRKWYPSIALVLFAFCGAQAATQSGDSLAVFGTADTRVRIFDAATLATLGEADVGSAPLSVVYTNAGNIAVATGGGVAFVDQNLQFKGIVELHGEVSKSPSAMLPTANALWVSVGGRIAVIDERSLVVAAWLDPGFEVDAIVDLPSAGLAMALSGSQNLAVYVSTDALEIVGSPFLLPPGLAGFSRSPSSQMLAASEDAVYDLAGVKPVFGGATIARAATEVAIEPLGPSGFFLRRGTNLHIGNVSDPTKLQLVASDVRDVAVIGDQGFAVSNNQLIRINSQGQVLSSIELAFAASGLAAFPASAVTANEAPQRIGQFSGQLLENFGDGQIVTPGQSFLIGVLALDENQLPQQNLAVFVSAIFPSPSAATCTPAVTDSNGQATLTCSAGTDIFGSVIQLTVEDALGRKISFGITVSTSSFSDGLNKLSGDLAVIPRNSDFSLAVQALDAGSPQISLPLTITRVPNDSTAVCASVVFTGIDGIASIPCVAGFVTSAKAVQITVSDGFGRFANFTVTIIPEAVAPNGLSIVSGDQQVVARNSAFPLPLVVKYQVSDIPQIGVQLLVATDAPSILFCPSFVFTGIDGNAAIFCAAGNVAVPTTAHVFVTAPNSSSLPEPFEVNIVLEPPNAATRLTLLSSPVLQGQSGDTLSDAVRLVATDDLGVRISGATILYSSSSNVTFSPSIGITAFDGEAEASLTLGCPATTGFFSARLQDSATAINVPVVISNGDARVMEITQGNGQSGVSGELLQSAALVVRMTDVCGSGLRGIPVAWSVSPTGAATLENTVAVTDGLGRSSTQVRLGTRPGPFNVIARSGDLSQVFTITTESTPASIVALGGDGQSVWVGETTARDLVVEVRSDQGIALPGISVTFSLTSGSGTLTIFGAVTDSQGRASTRYTAGQTIGDVVVTVSLSSEPQISTRFQLRETGRAPDVASLQFLNGGSWRPGWVPGSTGALVGSGIVDDLTGVLTAGPAPFPTELRGVRVTVSGIRAPILGIANVNGMEQVNIQVPFEIRAPSSATVVIEINGAVVTVPGVQILTAQPGIYEFSFSGRQYGAALHTDFSTVTPLNPAKRGETILLFLTGLGPVAPTVPTNVAGPVPAAEALFDVAVGIDHVGMVNSGAFYAPGLLSAFQINFVVGDTVAFGERKLNVVAQGVSSQEVLFPVGP